MIFHIISYKRNYINYRNIGLKTCVYRIVLRPSASASMNVYGNVIKRNYSFCFTKRSCMIVILSNKLNFSKKRLEEKQFFVLVTYVKNVSSKDGYWTANFKGNRRSYHCLISSVKLLYLSKVLNLLPLNLTQNKVVIHSRKSYHSILYSKSKVIQKFSYRLISKHSITYYVPIRYMQTSRGFLGQQVTKVMRRHSYPPMNLRTYKGVNYIEPHNLRTEDGLSLTQHETTHAIVATDDLKTGLGLLTSAKKPKPAFTPTIIDSVNYKGENKDQFFAPFKNPRALSAAIVEEDQKITEYLTNKENLLDELLSKVKKVKAIKIVHMNYFDTPKDDETFTK